MKFDIKDLKSWSNRHDVRTLSVTGFFGTLCVYQHYRFLKFKRDILDHLIEMWTFHKMIVDTLDKISKRI